MAPPTVDPAAKTVTYNVVGKPELRFAPDEYKWKDPKGKVQQMKKVTASD
jgi:hypothetical protein